MLRAFIVLIRNVEEMEYRCRTFLHPHLIRILQSNWQVLKSIIIFSIDLLETQFQVEVECFCFHILQLNVDKISLGTNHIAVLDHTHEHEQP
jgi:hypothetical protein